MDERRWYRNRNLIFYKISWLTAARSKGEVSCSGDVATVKEAKRTQLELCEDRGVETLRGREKVTVPVYHRQTGNSS